MLIIWLQYPINRCRDGSSTSSADRADSMQPLKRSCWLFLQTSLTFKIDSDSPESKSEWIRVGRGYFWCLPRAETINFHQFLAVGDGCSRSCSDPKAERVWGGGRRENRPPPPLARGAVFQEPLGGGKRCKTLREERGRSVKTHRQM